MGLLKMMIAEGAKHDIDSFVDKGKGKYHDSSLSNVNITSQVKCSVGGDGKMYLLYSREYGSEYVQQWYCHWTELLWTDWDNDKDTLEEWAANKTFIADVGGSAVDVSTQVRAFISEFNESNGNINYKEVTV